MYVNTINNVTKRHMPAEREKQKVAVFDSAVILSYGNPVFLNQTLQYHNFRRSLPFVPPALYAQLMAAAIITVKLAAVRTPATAPLGRMPKPRVERVPKAKDINVAVNAQMTNILLPVFMYSTSLANDKIRRSKIAKRWRNLLDCLVR
jgi:hypothetical protein